MNQDSDVARVAAALRAPVIRYRNFGNGPTRNPPRPASAEAEPELALPDAALAEAVEPASRNEPLASADMAEPPLPTAEPSGSAQPMVGFARVALPPEAPQAPAGARPRRCRAAPQPLPLPAASAPILSAIAAATPQPASAAAPTPGPVPAMPPPAPIPAGLQNRQTAQSLLTMLRSTAARDGAPAAAPEEPPQTLLEALRASCLVNPPPDDGLLAVLTRPAVWDLPLAAPAASASAPLIGRPIRPLDTPSGGLLDLPQGGFGAAAQPPVEGATESAPDPAAREVLAAPRPVWIVEPAVPAIPPAEPALALAAAPGPASLAEVFRLVSSPPPSPAAEAPLQTDSLKDILRGLRPGRRA
jgi:hypothetical protein